MHIEYGVNQTEIIMKMDDKTTRWKQRFKNFEKSISLLQDAVFQKDLSVLEQAGVIQTYEITFELAWKTLKDFLESKEVIAQFPRDVIKEAFKNKIIKKGETWLDMLEKRNLMSHTYDETNAGLALQLIINSYFDELYDVYLTLNKLV